MQKMQKTNAKDSEKGEWVGVEGDIVFWYDASEVSAEVLYLLARYRFKKDLKVLKGEQSTRKNYSSEVQVPRIPTVKDMKTLAPLNCRKEGWEMS